MRILLLLALLVAATAQPVRCLDGTTRIDSMDCPGGVTGTFSTQEPTRGPEPKKFKCSDGSTRFDQSNCPGGETMERPHIIDASAPATDAAASGDAAKADAKSNGGEARFSKKALRA